MRIQVCYRSGLTLMRIPRLSSTKDKVQDFMAKVDPVGVTSIVWG